MSYTIPGRDPGVESTEPPSTPCTGDFFDKLHCRENGWFLWVGAFCVLVVICGLCSCFVVAPIAAYLRDVLGTDAFERKAVVAPAEKCKEGNVKKTRSKSHHEPNHHWYLDDVLKITHDDEMELGLRSPAYTVPAAKTTAGSSSSGPWWQQRNHNKRHDQDKELFGPSSRRSSMSSNRSASNRSVLRAASGASDHTKERANAANYRRHSRHLTAELIVDDPGIGAEATLRGGGWMGAANGRL